MEVRERGGEFWLYFDFSFVCRPRVQLLVTSMRKPTGLKIIFIEKNGLKHGEFSLIDKEDSPSSHTVGQVEFCSSGDLLAVSVLNVS